MNIMINSYCNLKCYYCFADNEITTCDDKNMTIETFEKVIELHKRNNIREMRIIGGEPTLHPHFKLFVAKVLEDPFFESLHFFSNMTFESDVTELLLMFIDEKRISILPNFNNKDITRDKFEIIKRNIKSMAEYGIVNSIGINLYSPDMDIDFFFETMEQTRLKIARWAITSPNHEIDSSFDVKAHYNKFYNLLIKFFDKCIEKGIKPNMDCSDIPICSFTPEQQAELVIRNPEMFTRKPCDEVLDINPKLEAFRCFGMSDTYKLKVHENMKIKTIGRLLREGNKKHVDNKLFEECESCPKYKRFGKSCACVRYRVVKDSE